MSNSKDDLVYNRFNSWSVMYHSEKLKEVARGNITTPVTMHIYPTNKCTHNCSFCIMAEDRSGGEQLDDKIYIETIMEAFALGVRCIHFSGGGEPMLHQKTSAAMQLAKELGITTILSTNGSIKLPDEAEHIRISLNAGTKETHEKIMGAKTWDRIMDNIKNAKEKNRIGLGFVLIHENAHEVYDLCKIASDNGLNFVHIRPAYLPEHDKEVQEASKIALEQTEKAIKDFSNLNIYSIKEKFDGYWTPRKYDKCLATSMNIVVKANGTLIPCQDRMDLEFGNIYKKSISDIWGSEEHEEVLKKINLDHCPRCVMTKVNEIIKNIYIDNKTFNELI